MSLSCYLLNLVKTASNVTQRCHHIDTPKQLREYLNIRKIFLCILANASAKVEKDMNVCDCEYSINLYFSTICKKYLKLEYCLHSIRRTIGKNAQSAMSL